MFSYSNTDKPVWSDLVWFILPYICSACQHLLKDVVFCRSCRYKQTYRSSGGVHSAARRRFLWTGSFVKTTALDKSRVSFIDAQCRRLSLDVTVQLRVFLLRDWCILCFIFFATHGESIAIMCTFITERVKWKIDECSACVHAESFVAGWAWHSSSGARAPSKIMVCFSSGGVPCFWRGNTVLSWSSSSYFSQKHLH